MHICIYAYTCMHICIHVDMCIHKYIKPGNRLYTCMYRQDIIHAMRLRICIYHIIETVKQNQWTQKFSVDHQEVPACCGGIHDLLVFMFRVINELCKNFPNHVSICLSLQDIRNMNFSLLSRCINVGSLELILVNKDLRSLIFTRQLVAKCSSSSTSRQVEQSLWFGSNLDRV